MYEEFQSVWIRMTGNENHRRNQLTQVYWKNGRMHTGVSKSIFQSE